MFLIFRRTATAGPRRTVVAAGAGVTDISASVQGAPAAAFTFASVVPPCVPPWASSPAPADGLVPAPADGLVPPAVSSPGSGSDGLPAPGSGSVKDGSSSGVDDAE